MSSSCPLTDSCSSTSTCCATTTATCYPSTITCVPCLTRAVICVVCYQVSLGDLLDLVNIGLDIALLATGHTTMGSIFLATDMLLTNDDLMEKHVLYLLDKGPNEKGKILMTRMNDAFMEKLLRNDPVTFELYHGNQKKGERQSAANILPILVKKGLIQDYHHKK